MPHGQGWPGSNDGAFLSTTPAARARVRYMAGGLSLCETRASCPYARIQAQGVVEPGSRNEELWAGWTPRRQRCRC